MVSITFVCELSSEKETRLNVVSVMLVSHRSHTSSEMRHTHVNTVPACSGTETPPSELETPASGILHSHLWIHEPPVRSEDDIFRSFTLTIPFTVVLVETLT